MNVNELIGKTIVDINLNGPVGECDEIIFTCSSGDRYLMYHAQDCCESVYLEDICGNISDLIGSIIVMAEEVINDNMDNPLEDADASFTWTFYKFATNKGYVTLRWFGTSNGYYSESVDFKKIRI